MNVITVSNGIPMQAFASEIRKYVKNTSKLNIWDIGSRDGKDAIELKRAFPGSTAWGFEAHPTEYEIHKGVSREINWVNSALYNHDGEIDFYPKAINSGIHSIRDRGSEFGTGVIRVPCCKVSTFINRNTSPIPDVVKVDVEGCSYEVLSSFEEYLGHVLALHVESEEEKYFKDQHLQAEVFGYLTEKGFTMTMYSITKGSNQHDSVWISNKCFHS